MKIRLSTLVGFLPLLFLVVVAMRSRAVAQTPAQLDLQLYAGLSITGAVGTVYTVEYVTDLARTNDWRCLTFLQLPTTNYLWFDPTAPATGRRFYRAVEFAAPTNLVFIPPGTFRMGRSENDVEPFFSEGLQTPVTVNRGFWMGKYEVTQGEYLAVMGNNPSRFNGDFTAEGGENYGTDLSRPVEAVSWNDATNYCGQLTQRERAAGRIAANSVYRLPTSEEWEYACRAWTSTRFSYGDDAGYTNLTNYAWYYGNSGETTHPVGQKLPNPWGLYDMHGNVLEWCQDWRSGYSDGHEIRGGGWMRPASYCRSAARFFFSGNWWGGNEVGFRVVLAPDAVHKVPFHGTIQTSETVKSVEFPIVFNSSIGSGNANLLGQFTWALDVQINISDPALTTATGTGVLTSANGDSLFTQFTAFATNTETPDVIFITEVHTITSGTGRFAGATGTFTREALSNLALGFSSGSFDGFIVY